MPNLTEDPLANYDPGDAAELRSAAGVVTPTAPTASQEPALTDQSVTGALVPTQPSTGYDEPPMDDEPPHDWEPGDYAAPADFDQVPPPEFSMDDVPPADEYEPAPRQRDEREPRGKQPPGTPEEREDMADSVLSSLRDCLAATHGSAGQEVIDLLTYMTGSDNALAYLDKKTVQTWRRVANVLRGCAADDPSRQFDLFDVPDLEAASSRVIVEIDAVRARVGAKDLPKSPTSTWRALVDRVQRLVAKDGARRILEGIEDDLPDEDLMKAFSELEPPTTRKSLMNSAYSRTAGEWERAEVQAAAERPLYRLSSGYPTLDWAVTAKNKGGDLAEPLGTFAPGEFWVVAAGSGMGKSSFTRPVIRAITEDGKVGWQHRHFTTLIAHTEESPKVIYEAAALGAGDPFHHLAENVVIADIGASRVKLCHAVWDLVIEAYHRSKETGKPIVDCGLPEFIVLDYITGVQGPGESETLASEITANYLMRGLANWKLSDQESYTGENFAAYAGMSWPEGMDNFRPAVMALAQFRKLEGVQAYEPGKCNVDDFVVEDANGQPMWEVQPGDFRIPKIAEIRGSGVIVQNATGVLVLHRSRPTATKFKDPETGENRLSDDRARFIFLKTRNSADMKSVPMRFDSNPSGKRGQFYDLLAEKAIQAGKLRPLPSYTRAGDAIVPPRPTKSPFDGVAY